MLGWFLIQAVGPAAARDRRKLGCATLLGGVVPLAQVPTMQLHRAVHSTWLSLWALLLQPLRLG